MGEDFLRRRNDRFVRQRDASFIKLFEPDLFAALPPETIATVYGSVLCAIDAANELWTPELDPAKPIRFFSGDQLAVEIVGPSATHLFRNYGNSAAPLLAQVVEIDAEEGIARLRVRCAR